MLTNLQDAPAVDELASRLRLTITRVARRLRQEGAAGLSPTLVAALSTLERVGPMSPSQLAEAEGVQRPTMTRTVAGLEADGLIERTRNPADGRGSQLRISRAGRRLLERLRRRKTAFFARRLAALDPHDLGVLDEAAAILDRILAVGEGARD